MPDELEVLSLVLTIRQHNKRIREAVPDVGPMVEHCSAGIGRTGTMLVIDILFDVLEQKGLDTPIDIQQTIAKLRTQRSGVIQTAV